MMSEFFCHSGARRRREPGIQSYRARCLQPWIPGSFAEFIIGPRFARTRWLAPRNDNG